MNKKRILTLVIVILWVQQYEYIGINKGSVVVTFKYQKDGSNEVLDTKKITLVVDKNLNIKKK